MIIADDSSKRSSKPLAKFITFISNLDPNSISALVNDLEIVAHCCMSCKPAVKLLLQHAHKYTTQSLDHLFYTVKKLHKNNYLPSVFSLATFRAFSLFRLRDIACGKDMKIQASCSVCKVSMEKKQTKNPLDPGCHSINNF